MVSNSNVSISKHQFIISGILTTVFGVDELSPGAQVVCLWLHHGRLGTQESMQPLACQIINVWNARSKSALSAHSPKGLIAVTFDQRNHGSRMIDNRANKDWRAGDKTHAQDMFSIYHGTAVDNTVLLDHLATYVFPRSSHIISNNIILGVSLGGHSAWQCVFHEKRFRAAVIVIGCPDYIRLMSHRARQTGLDSWYGSTPPGANFLGSDDFPSGLIDAVHERDPAGRFLGTNHDGSIIHDPEARELREIFRQSIAGKKIMVLSGAADTLVPYACAKPFLEFLKHEIATDEHLIRSRTHIEDLIFPNTGHEMSKQMVQQAVRFIIDTMLADSNNRSSQGCERL